MGVLVWLLIPLLGAVVAGLWSIWASRHRIGGGVDDTAGVRGYQAFRAAMEQSGAASATRPVPGSPPEAAAGGTARADG